MFAGVVGVEFDEYNWFFEDGFIEGGIEGVEFSHSIFGMDYCSLLEEGTVGEYASAGVGVEGEDDGGGGVQGRKADWIC